MIAGLHPQGPVNPDLMELAAGQDWLVEHGPHASGEGLGPIEDRQDRAGHIQAPVP
jgi:hypothetical protein